MNAMQKQALKKFIRHLSDIIIKVHKETKGKVLK
jgi:hypothetical protein